MRDIWLQRNLRLFIIALFGSVMFITRVFVPAPIDRILIVVDAVLLALSGMFIKGVGAMYVGAVGGILVSLWRPSLIPFSIIYTFIYGVLVDVFLYIFRINATSTGVNRNRLIAAMAVNTLLIGFISYYATTMFPMLIQPYPILDMMVAFFGPVTGAVSGYAAAYLWNKHLKTISA